MLGWKYVLDLSSRWGEDWDESNIHEMGKCVANQIKRTFKDYPDYAKWGFQFEEIVDMFEATPTQEESDSLNRDNMRWCVENNKESEYFVECPLEYFNGWMTELYDFADRERIGIER